MLFLPESQEKIRAVKVSPSSATEDLINIKLTLLKISNNAIESSLKQMKALQTEFSKLCKSKDLFTSVDQQESLQIKQLFSKLKKTHPEICSDVHFENKGNAGSQKGLSTSQEIVSITQPSEDVDKSRSLILKPDEVPFKKPSRNAKRKKDENLSMKSKNLNVTSKSFADDLENSKSFKELEGLNTEQKIDKYVRWAVELRDELKKQEKKTK